MAVYVGASDLTTDPVATLALLLNVPSPIKAVSARLSTPAKLVLSDNPHRSVAALLDDCVSCAADAVITDGGGPPWDADAFARLATTLRGELTERVLEILDEVEQVLSVAHQVERRLAATADHPSLRPALVDIRAQLTALVYPGFITAAGWRRLPDLVRYLRAIERRLEKLPDDPQRDRAWMLAVQDVWRAYTELVDLAGPLPDTATADELTNIRWMVEELRVSYFAQSLKTAYPVSEKRIYRAMDQLSARW